MATCSCGQLAIVRTSWTDQNPGRRFYSCPDRRENCHRRGFVGWLDPPMCPRVVHVIPGLLRARNRLEEERDELKAKNRRKNMMIFMLVIILGLLFGKFNSM